MGTDLHWEDENGKLLDSVFDSANAFACVLGTDQLAETVCLRFIDPYGNTTFNQWQIPCLIEELESLLESVVNSDSQAKIRQMLNLAYRSKGEVHTYLKFYGD